MKKTGVGKWDYSRVGWRIVMTRANYDENWIEQRDMTTWERIRYPFIWLGRRTREALALEADDEM